MPEAVLRRLSEPRESSDEFLAMVSHELRTPITAILAWSEVLDRQYLNEATAAKAVEAIRQSAQLQAQLVEDLIDYSRITAHKLSLKCRTVSLQPIIKAAIDAVTPMALKKLIELEMDFVSSENEIEGDVLRLQQVFSNLLSNAIKFTPTGGKVSVKLETRDGNSIATVSDTGEGISAEFLPFIFDCYRQANLEVDRHSGLGLGLTIAHHIVELHGGTIHAYSEGKWQGSAFTIQLPQKHPGHKISWSTAKLSDLW